MRHHLPLLMLPLLATAAAPPAPNPTALLECRLDGAKAYRAQLSLREIGKTGDEGHSETMYDVAKLRPYGTKQPKLVVTTDQAEQGVSIEYRIELAGDYGIVRKALLKATRTKECETSTNDSCQFSTADHLIELMQTAKGQLLLICRYVDS